MKTISPVTPKNPHAARPPQLRNAQTASRRFNFARAAALVMLAALLPQFAAPSAFATTFYWDMTGATPGFGTAGGTWAQNSTTSGRWSTDSAGSIAGSLTQVTANTDTFNFGTAALALGAGTITVSGGVTMGSTTYGSASGAIVLSGSTITFSAAPTITVNNTSDTISSVVAGAATSFTKAGTGTLILSGANTYSGSTALNGGTVNAGVAQNGTTSGPLGTSGAIAFGGGTLQFSTASASWDPSSRIASGTSSGAVKIDVNGKAVTFGSTLTSSQSGGLTLTDTAGSGSLTLSVANTHSGATTVSAGILSLGNGLALQNSPLDTTASAAGNAANGLKTTVTTLTVGGLSGSKDLASVFTTTSGGYSTVTALTLNPATSQTYSGIIADGASGMTLTKTGAGTQTLAGSSTYTGGTTISGGAIGVSTSSGALGYGPVAFSASGVRLAVSPGLDFTNAITIGLNAGVAGNGLIMPFGASAGTATFSGPITINNSALAGGIFAAAASQILNVKGAITSSVDVSSRAGTVMFSGGGTGYTVLTVNQDTAMVGANNGIATTAMVNLSGSGAANLDLNGFNQSLAGINRVAANTTIIGNSSTTADSTLTTTGTSSYAGVIQNVLGSGTRTVSLTVNGGSLTLSGANTYTGPTTNSAGTLTIGGAGKLGNGTYATNIINNGTLNYNSSASQTLSGIISGSGAFNYLGTGGLTLSGANTYSGGTTMANGTVTPGSGSAFGTGTVTINAGATAYPVVSMTITNSLALNGGYLHVGGSSDTVIWSGPVTVANGFVMAGDNAGCVNNVSGPIDIGTGGIYVTNNTGNGQVQAALGDILSGTISGSGGITYYCIGGNSRLTVQGANTYSGNTLVNGTSNGKLNVYGGLNPFSTGTVTLNAGAVIEAYPGNVTITNALTLNGGILEGESQYNNYNRLTWAGPITLTAHSTLYQFGQNNGQMSQGVNVSGSLNMNGYTLTNSGNSGLYNGSSISGPISGTGTILQTVNNLYLQGSNTFSGTFRAVGGMLTVQNAYALQDATLDMNAADSGSVTLMNGAVIGALTGSRNLSLSTFAVSIGNNNSPATYSGALSGAGGSLTKIGTSTLTLGNANTYSGNTTINAGTLALSSSGSIANSPVISIASAAVFDVTSLTAGAFTLLPSQTLKGNGTLRGNVVVDGTLSVGASIGALTDLGNVTWAPGGTNVVEIGSLGSTPGVDCDFLSVGGELDISVTNGAPAANKFTIKLVAAGAITGFGTVSNFWPIATATNGVFGFNAGDKGKFNLDLTGFTNNNNLAGGRISLELMDSNVVVLYTPASPPACAYTTTNWFSLHIITNGVSPNLTYTTNAVMTFSNASYLTSVQALTLSNCTLTGNAYTNGGLGETSITGINRTNRTSLPYQTFMLVLTAEKTNQTMAAAVNALVIDTCGRGKSFDPVITTLAVTSGNQVTQRFEGLLSAEHYLRVINASPGLKWLEINLNGHVFRLDPLADSQDVSADLWSAMHEGADNVVILTGGGDVGASAFVTITDTASGNLVALPEIVTLGMSQTTDGLVLAWPDTLTGWELQGSASAGDGWSAVASTPVSVNGQFIVNVPTTSGPQFYRLAGPAPAPAAANGTAPTASESSARIAGPTDQTAASNRLTYEGILW